eukprot:TRINITY_DN8156_c0_g4_i5.p1 TRINITY_DN8156_c0_g4~~TRINITY_DN8156_c0_g4_i5.p1  ORF type:complete len:240 (+),score=43.00 TRINITY_DN8156_c0_g4_i5:72-722(+)
MEPEEPSGYSSEEKEDSFSRSDSPDPEDEDSFSSGSSSRAPSVADDFPAVDNLPPAPALDLAPEPQPQTLKRSGRTALLTPDAATAKKLRTRKQRNDADSETDSSSTPAQAPETTPSTKGRGRGRGRAPAQPPQPPQPYMQAAPSLPRANHEPSKTSVWIECEIPECGKWRRLPPELPAARVADLQSRKFFCYMNPDLNYANCNIPEESYDAETLV